MWGQAPCGERMDSCGERVDSCGDSRPRLSGGPGVSGRVPLYSYIIVIYIVIPNRAPSPVRNLLFRHPPLNTQTSVPPPHHKSGWHGFAQKGTPNA